MRQIRLDQWLNINQKPMTSYFLALPPKIRQKIYDEAGLALGCTINLCYCKEHNEDYGNLNGCTKICCHPPHPDDVYWDGCPTTYNLLQTCRTIYNDIIPVIYSSNTFIINYCDLETFQPLRNLNPNSLAFLSRLVIKLNTSCCETLDCKTSNHKCQKVYKGINRKLEGNSYQDKLKLKEWQKTAAWLAKHMPPNQLRIRFTCETNDYKTAEQILAPFSQLPSLRSCCIRLSCSPNWQLRQLAKETAVYSTGGIIISRFLFCSLPRELQIKILSFSDLVAPTNIRWSPRFGFRLDYIRRGCEHVWWGCYCPVSHSAFYSKCRCWAPPSALFLVNQNIRLMALEVFYSQNRFIIEPIKGKHKPVKESPSTVEASLFFEKVIPRYAMRYLRFLEITFPPFKTEYLPSTSSGYQNWLSSISYLSNHANLPKLTLIIRMDDVHEGYNLPFRPGITKDQKTTVFKMYARVCLPLVDLKGLRDLFIDLIYPSDAQEGYIGSEQWDFRITLIEKLERMLEQKVMGMEYNSMARGKRSIMGLEQDYGSTIDEDIFDRVDTDPYYF